MQIEDSDTSRCMQSLRERDKTVFLFIQHAVRLLLVYTAIVDQSPTKHLDKAIIDADRARGTLPRLVYFPHNIIFV